MDVYLYCSDRSRQREIKDEIEKDTGVNIRRVVRNIDPIKDYGIGIILIDDNLDLSGDFKSTDILVALEDMEFDDWLYLTERGLDVIKCDNGFSNLKWLLRIRGADGVEDLGDSDIGKVVSKKASIKDHFQRYDGGVYAFYSVDSGVGKSTIVFNSATVLKNNFTNKRVVIIDRGKQFSSFNYLVNNSDRFEKVSGVLENLYKDIETDVFIYSPNSSVRLLKSIGTSDIVNIIDSMKKHFDYILIDADNLFDTDLMDIIEMSKHIYVVAEDNKESTDKTLGFMTNTLSKFNKPYLYTLVVNKHTGGTYLENIGFNSLNIPFSDEIAADKCFRVYLKDNNKLTNGVSYMYHISEQISLDKKQIETMGYGG